LAKQDYVDPKRIYLGGHSTGGALVLLAAECTNCFRAVFAFGPVADVQGYGEKYLPFDLSNRQEVALRAPGRWLHGIHNPTYIFEGTGEPSNYDQLIAMARLNRNPLVHFHPVKGGTHFSILSPISRLVATKILHDNGPAPGITFTGNEVTEAFGK